MTTCSADVNSTSIGKNYCMCPPSYNLDDFLAMFLLCLFFSIDDVEFIHLINKFLFEFLGIKVNFFHVNFFRFSSDQVVVTHPTRKENVGKVIASQLTMTVGTEAI